VAKIFTWRYNWNWSY